MLKAKDEDAEGLMDANSKTLYIPLYGKAYVSRKGVILRDPKAEEIWAREGFPLRGKSRSRWLAYFMGMRAAVMDDWLRERLSAAPDALVLHIGCGLDSRAERVQEHRSGWFDIDLGEVIETRRRYYDEAPGYYMLGGNAAEPGWLASLPGSGQAVVVMEGLSMYLAPNELQRLFLALRSKYNKVELLMDVYTGFAARASKYGNPIKNVGAGTVFGIDDPRAMEAAPGICFKEALSMTPENKIAELRGFERRFFRIVFAGKATEKLYKLYSYEMITE